MKKLMIGCCIFCFAAVQVSAQIPTFTKGDNLVSASLGFGGYYSGSYYSGVTRIPFISLYYENCVKDNLFDEKSSLGIGGILGHTSVKASNSFKTSVTLIGVRGALHYSFVDKLDTYAGLMLGYEIVSWKWLDKNSSDLGLKGNAASDLGFSLFLGARYYFTDTFGVFAEVGYGAAVINLGVSLKF